MICRPILGFRPHGLHPRLYKSVAVGDKEIRNKARIISGGRNASVNERAGVNDRGVGTLLNSRVSAFGDRSYEENSASFV